MRLTRKGRWVLGALGIGVLCIAGAAAQRALRLAPEVALASSEPGASAQQATDTAALSSAQQTASYQGVQALTVSVRNGEVDYTAAASGAPVSVSWSVDLDKLRTLTQPDLSQIQLVPLEHSGSLSLTDTRPDKDTFLSSARMKVSISAPRNLPLSVNLGNGTLKLDTDSLRDLQLGNGTVHLAGALSTDSSVNIGNGTLEAQLALTGGQHDVHIGHGSLQLELDPLSSLQYELQTALGSVEIDGQAAAKQNLVGAGASGKLGTGSGRLDVQLGAGSINLDTR